MVTLFRFAEMSLKSDVIGNLPSKAILVGAAGVDFFFVLSGFLITGILLDTKSSPHYFRNFYIRRTLRIFPLYFGSLLLFLVLLPYLGNNAIVDTIKGSHLHLWIYTANLKIAWVNEFCYGSLNHYWSLAIEEQFYLVWPLVVFFVSPKTLVRLCVALLVGFALWRIGSSLSGIGENTEKTFTLFRVDGLLLGALAANWVRNTSTLSDQHGRWRIALVVAGVAYAATLLMGKSDFTMRYTVVSVLATVLLLTALSSKSGSLERLILEHPILRSLGKYSYAMYVFQLPLIVLVDKWISPKIFAEKIGHPFVAGIAFVIVMFSITYLLGVISWYAFESWFLRLRSVFTSPHGPVAPTRLEQQATVKPADSVDRS
jgi:peptidoglycan/LPS O-acetylase OafA/YrhL